MTKLTEPGTTKMWDRWFTTHWVPILIDMVKRQQPNKSTANAHDIATKAAKTIRMTIKTGLLNMWKTRNEIKYDKRAPNLWTTKDIKRVITEYEKHTGRNERYGIQEIGEQTHR